MLRNSDYPVGLLSTANQTTAGPLELGLSPAWTVHVWPSGEFGRSLFISGPGPRPQGPPGKKGVKGRLHSQDAGLWGAPAYENVIGPPPGYSDWGHLQFPKTLHPPLASSTFPSDPSVSFFRKPVPPGAAARWRTSLRGLRSQRGALSEVYRPLLTFPSFSPTGFCPTG